MTHWVFAYGSLIWKPEFVSLRRMPARLEGYHRSLCLFSHHYRGTPENLGLVFALDDDGECEGIAYEVADENWIEVDAFLRKRELVSDAYLEVMHDITLSDGRTVSARTYVMNHASGQYAGYLTIPETVEYVKRGIGTAGSCRDYVLNTMAELKALGIRDERLEKIISLL